MNKQEFDKFIQSFNKKPDEYTKEEVIEISQAHRKLDNQHKDWKQLAKDLGGGYTWEDLKTLSKNAITTHPNDKVQKYKMQDMLNIYTRTLRNEARVDLFKDAIIEAISSLKPFDKVKCIDNGISDQEAVLLISDWHLGVECDNFYNKFDINIAKGRIDTLCDKTIKYCKANNVKRLNVINLGDLAQGIIHTNARIEATLDITQQVILASELLANFLNELQRACPEIIYRSVLDNHSRVIANKNEHIEKESFCRIIDWYIKERLKDSSIKFVEDNVDDGLGLFTLMNGKKIAFAHGHQDTKNAVAQNFMCGLQEYIPYICMGHYHSSVTKNFQNCRVFINGSLVGTEQYALSKRLFSKPCQKLIIFNSIDDDILDIDISFFDEKKELRRE